MPDDRYFTHLLQLAHKHALPLTRQAAPDAAGRALLAHGLARIGHVVLCVQFTGNQAEAAQQWVGAYARAYQLLAEALFTPFTAFQAAYLDSQSPSLILLTMEAGLLAQALARTFTPYLALLSHGYHSSMAELDGLLNSLLNELLADDLGAGQRSNLHQQLHEILLYLARQRQTSYSFYTFRNADMVAPSAAGILLQPPQDMPPPAPPPNLPAAPPLADRPKTGPLPSWDSHTWQPPPPSSSDSKVFMPVPDPPRKRPNG